MTTRALIRGVLFDLDGTLLDTAPDLIAACNAARLSEDLPPCTDADLRPLVSHGAGRMLEHAFGPTQSTADFARRLDLMLSIYRAQIADRTRLFDGMHEVLETLENRACPWGIVTNKLAWLTDPLLELLGLLPRAACVISGDTLAEKKPHPLPLWEAARRIERDPSVCVYIGDAARDIEAGQRAGMATLAATYGYLGIDEHPETWGADAMVNHPRDLLTWLKERL